MFDNLQGSNWNDESHSSNTDNSINKSTDLSEQDLDIVMAGDGHNESCKKSGNPIALVFWLLVIILIAVLVLKQLKTKNVKDLPKDQKEEVYTSITQGIADSEKNTDLSVYDNTYETLKHFGINAKDLKKSDVKEAIESLTPKELNKCFCAYQVNNPYYEDGYKYFKAKTYKDGVKIYAVNMDSGKRKKRYTLTYDELYNNIKNGLKEAK